MIGQFVDSETCLRCQGCCRFKEADSAWGPAFLKEEARHGKDNKICAAGIGKDNKIKLKKLSGQSCFICTFLDVKSNACSIYAVRPFECRLYPFLINRDKGKVYLSLDTGCPFAQRSLETVFLKTYARSLFEFLSTEEQKNILKNNPSVIQCYGNLLNLFELKLD